MADTWGISWGPSWENSWSLIDVPITPSVDSINSLVPPSLITTWGLTLYATPPQRKGAPERKLLAPVEQWTMEYLLTLNEPVYQKDDEEDSMDYGYHFWSLLNAISA